MFTREAIRNILNQVSKRKLSAQKAFHKLRNLSYEALSFAKLDHHRSFRKSLPEVVYAEGKSSKQLQRIVKSLAKNGAPLIMTRLEKRKFNKLKRVYPKLKYSELGRIGYVTKHPVPGKAGQIAIVTAGTSDIPVAEEARTTLSVLGHRSECFYDLGVAGLHRLLDHLPKIEKADFVICIAGMEGALPSVLAGLISKPIIAVPTSVGYGSGIKGISALLTMLNSCSQGVAVVNIDSGFNAACFVHLLKCSF